jgi:hypothetical protein
MCQKNVTTDDGRTNATILTVSVGQVDYRLLHFWLCIEHGQSYENTGAAPASLRSGSTRLREHVGGSNLAVYKIDKPFKRSSCNARNATFCNTAMGLLANSFFIIPASRNSTDCNLCLTICFRIIENKAI